MEMDNNHRSSKLHTRTRSRTAAAISSPALLSPSEQIYREIFAGFHGGARGRGGDSSIPVLDLPPADETESLFDFRFFNYSEVFGGSEAIDYAVPFHELFRQSNGGYASSSDDAWTPVETECLSEEWDGSSYYSKRKSFGNESNGQSVVDGKQFNMSFQQKRQLKGVSTTGLLAPVHVAPGYAVVIDQIAPSQNIELQNPQLVADGDDDKLIKRGRSEEKNSDKLAPFRETIEQEKADVPNYSNEKYVTISEINLRTQPNDMPPPSRPPPIFDARYGNTSQATSSIRATCSSMNFCKSISGNDSPPFVDVEVDGRFSAADFASSLKVSVKKSQVTLKTIKENLQNKNVCAKDETERNAAVRKSRNSFDNLQYPSKKESSRTSNSAQSSPDVIQQNHLLNSSDRRKSKQSWSLEDSSEARSSGEWSAAPEFIELVRSEKNRNHKQDNEENISVQNGIVDGGKEDGRIFEHENKIHERVSITCNKLEDHVKCSKAMSEVASPDEKCKEVLMSLQTTHRCKKVERKAYEDDQQPEDNIFIDIMNNEHEIKKELNKFKQKVKFDEERAGDARIRLKESFVANEDDQRVRKTCEIRLIDHIEQTHSGILKDGQIKQQNERVRNIYMEGTQKPCFKEAFGDEENFKNQNKANEKEQKEKQLNETKRTSRETSEKEENERREKEEEYVAKLMEASENEAEDMLKVALEEVNKRIIMEEVERAEREKEMKNDIERFQDLESLVELSLSKDMMFEHNDEKEPKAIKKVLMDPNMMTGSQRSSYLTPDADINTKATDHRICKTEKIKEETVKILNSVCELNQDNVGSAQEVIIVPGKKSNYKQTSDEERMNAKYTTGTDINELLSATHESTALPSRTSMSSNSSGEASLHEDEFGVRINHKVPYLGRDSKNLPEKVKVGKVTMLENFQAQTKSDSHDEVDISKDKFAQKTDKAIASNNRSVSVGRKQTYNLSQQNKTGQTVGGKENCRSDGIESEERAKLERERRAREIELERLREMEEEWEREREREKDRVAFESVTRNVQEAASAGLRERASVNEATVARACQNDLGNARERLENSCLEADVKSCSDKISMEAKMRQDKSAVKRAYAESHEPADRSVSFNTATDPSISITNDGGVEGESAQRCKARLERQQRTAERAAKALAEKNTRDVIAQREQAEKHRLAESLDAEVKRWANGKQGNLRALLSTMHYILGADSGWQPVPLTTIITSVAVKKAYRKATLCVHPDKLQQRHATIQQKYICEKVFDLLKEAWNRFNSEER